MSSKVTWADIYKMFRASYPNLRNEVLDYRPHSYMTILLYLRDGEKMTYDAVAKECKFVDI